MSNPLEISVGGRGEVEPTKRAVVTVVAGGKFSGLNPFVPILISEFPHGALATVNEFASLSEFLNYHDPDGLNGTGAKLGRFAFQPGVGTERGTPLLRTVRLGTAGQNPPVAAAKTFQSSAPANVLTLTANNAGLAGNKIAFQIESGTSTGHKVTVARDRGNRVRVWSKSGDNLLNVFSLHFSTAGTFTVAGAGTVAATLTTTRGGVPPAGTANLSLTLSNFANCQELVNYLNAQTGYTCAPADTDLDLSTLSTADLDLLADISMDSSDNEFTEAKIGSIVAWVNANAAYLGPDPQVAGVTASRVASATATPANIAWTYLTGGTEPAKAVEDLEGALAAVDTAEIESGVIFLDTATTAWQQAVEAWALDQDTTNGRRFRMSFGMAAATTAGAAAIRASLIGNHRAALIFQRFLDASDTTVTNPPIYAAAALAGMTGGMQPFVDAQSLVKSRRRLKAASVLAADRLTKTQRNTALKAGVNVFIEKGGQVLFDMVVTTDQGSIRAWRMWSEACILDMLAIHLEQAIDPSVFWATKRLAAVLQAKATQVLDQYAQAELISGGVDANGVTHPAYTVPVITLEEGLATISTSVGMVGEVDHIYIPVTVQKVAVTVEG